MADAGVLATVLLIAGLFLIALELMIPSFGVLGISAAICLVISLWSACQAWWGMHQAFFWTYVGFLGFGLPGVLFGAFWLIQHTPLGGVVVLRAPLSGRDGASPRVRDRLEELVGQTGRAVSPLAPGGIVELNGERFHAESVGPVIESGALVRVESTRGTRFVVRETKQESVAGESDENDLNRTAESGADSERQAAETQASRSDDDKLDFQVPDNYTAE